MSADEAAALIRSGSNVGMSGFTGAGYPKVVPQALAHRIMTAKLAGEKFHIGVWTGASTAPELDGALAMVDGINLRLPYQSDPTSRNRINAGELEYLDIHLSHVAQHVRNGFYGKLHVALIELTAILEDGRLVPSSSLGNNRTWLDLADKVILEVNSWQPEKLDGMHDIPYGVELPPYGEPVPIRSAGDRIGEKYYRCDPRKIVAIVETNAPDRNSPFSPPDANSERIAGHILEFLQHEVKKGRMKEGLLPLQSGVGNIANAVLIGLKDGPFRNLTAYTEVIQDGMLDLLVSEKMRIASATAFSLSPTGVERLQAGFDHYNDKIISAPAGNQQSPRSDPAPWLHRDERHHRSRHLWQRELHPRDGHTHSERHRRLRRLRPQRLYFDLHDAVSRQERSDFQHRTHGAARRPHRA